MAQEQRGSRTRFAEDVLDLPSGDMPEAPGVGTGMHLATQAAPFQLREVRKERDLKKVLANVALMADQFGDTPGSRWVYSWMTKNRDGSRSEVKGGTIKMANAIAALYGNCDIDVRVIDEGARWVFYARFVDLETGFSTVRAYQQRKEQTIGMKDAQRALDIVFQIGQSKALRNVILNAIPHVAAYAMDAALESNYKKVAGKPEVVRERIKGQLEKWGPSVLKRVEQAYARTVAHWTVQDMSRMVGEIESIIEGMANVDEVWPPDTTEDAPANTTGGPTPNPPKPDPTTGSGPKDKEDDGKVKGTDTDKPLVDAGKPALRIIYGDDVIANTLKHDLKTGDPVDLGALGMYQVDKFVLNEETTLPDIYVRKVTRIAGPTTDQTPKATKSTKTKPTFGDE